MKNKFLDQKGSMRILKTIKYFALCSLISLSTVQYSNANDFENFSDNLDLMEDDPALDDIPILSSNQTRTTPSDIISALLAFGGVELLQHDIFLRTNPIVKRSLLDYPFFCSPVKPQYTYCWDVGAHLFYNQTSRCNFTADSTCINSYLNIADQDLLDAIGDFANKIREFIPRFTTDPLNILPLFNNATVQDRRIGFMFHALRQADWGKFRIYLPLYYQERNFFLTDTERESIERELGALTYDQQQKFQKEHLISDKFGFGDTRMNFDFEIYNHKDFTVQLGVQATIPTAVALVKGIKGSDFDKCPSRPNFSFESFFDIVDEFADDPTRIKEETTKILQDFFLGTLDVMAANLLETSLGNDGHFGLGAVITTDTYLNTFIHRAWADNIYLNTRTSLEYLFPGYERRFFVAKVDFAEFNKRNFEDLDPIVAAANLAFLDVEFVNRFYPYCCRTIVNPGLVLHSLAKGGYEGDSWGFDTGIDFWLQGKEKIGKPSLKALSNCCTLDSAQAPLAYQGKIFGSFLIKANRENYEWIVSFNGDYTVFRSGIGKDFTISLNLENNF